MNCKVCGKKSESEYCFIHKPRKPIKTNMKTSKSTDMRDFFTNMWKKKSHYCENCGKWLGKEPLSYMFDHTLEKSKYPDLKYEENNIMMLCLTCHDDKSNGKLTEKIIEKINKTKELYNIN